MNVNDTDLQLLARYVQEHAEDAFSEIVRRHLNLVFSAALRQVRSPQFAEEVAQSVFIDLARQACRLAPDTILSAWLYQVTRRTAIDVVRRESRRQRREQVAGELTAMNATSTDWSHIEPLLDEAMHALDDTDRAAVLLRYFENKSFLQVGQTLGTTEDAARKRVSRAVDRMREFLTQRGVAVGATGLAAVVSANAVQAAPAGLAATISAAATLAGTAVATTTATATITKAIAMTALQKALITATICAVVGAGIYQAHKVRQLRDAIGKLHQQSAVQLVPPSGPQTTGAPLQPSGLPTQTESSPVPSAVSAVTGTNAADLYRKAFALYDALSDQEKKILGDWRTEPDGDQAAQLCATVVPILDLMHQATALTNCDWGLGPLALDAFAAYTPYMNHCRSLARTAAWGASHCRTDNSAAAVDDVLASLQMAHHESQFALISFLVDTAIQGMATTVVAENASRLSGADRQRVILALKDPQYEEDFYRAIEQEVSMKDPQRMGNLSPYAAVPELMRQRADTRARIRHGHDAARRPISSVAQSGSSCAGLESTPQGDVTHFGGLRR